MKIGLPKIRLTRKVLFISVGILALLAGSGAAALYVGAAGTMAEQPKDSPTGGACTTIQTLVLKTPAKRLWLRKFIRMDHADGDERIKTALRVAGLLAKANPVDLVQVSVIDASGPVLKSRMRGRAIGAEVVIALQPKYLPDMKDPFIVRYYEGLPSDEGIYYGERVSLELPEIRKLMSAMKSAPDKQGCTEPEKPADAHAAKDDKKAKHGEQVVVIKGEKPAEHGEKPAEHGEKPADDKKAETHDAAPAKEQSFLDSVLSMVGLGGSDEKPAENHEAKTEQDSNAVADDPSDPAPAEEGHAAKPAEHVEDPAPAATDENAAEHAPAKVETTTEKHVEADPPAHGDQPVEKGAH